MSKIKTSIITATIITIITVVLILNIYSEVVPEAISSGNQMNDSQICESASCYYNDATSVCQVNSTNTTGCENSYKYIPLGGLFSGSGIVFIIIMGALLITLVMSFISKNKK